MAVQQFSLEAEYSKNTGITPQDIKKLRDWLNTQPHLPKEHITGGGLTVCGSLKAPTAKAIARAKSEFIGRIDLDLILTYHSCNQSPEVSKQVLDLHYTLRTLFTNFFKDRTFDKTLEDFMNIMLLQPLPTRSREGYAVLYCRLLNYEPKNYDLVKCLRAVAMVLDLWQYEEGTWPGLLLVFDMDQIRLGHLSRLDVQSTQQFLYYLQEAMLVKLKGIHFLNAPSFTDRIMMMIKPFMKNELLDMLKIHQIGSKTFDQYVPMDALPKEAGGKYKTYDELRDESITKLQANKEFFVAENNKRVVESLRPGKPKTISDIFGSIEGSFKKLEID